MITRDWYFGISISFSPGCMMVLFVPIKTASIKPIVLTGTLFDKGFFHKARL